MTLLFLKLGAVAAAIAAILGMALGLLRRGQQIQRGADAQKTLQQVEKRDEVDARVGGMSDDDVAEQLRSKWTR